MIGSPTKASRTLRVLLGLSCLLLPSQASATQVIANWDVVPFQKLGDTFKVGVVAFHETGVDVTFRVNGTVAATVTDPTWNDRTGVVEYWFPLHPSDYPDGPLTVSATASPEGTGHTARTLSDITLYANSGGSLTNSSIKWVDADHGSDTTGTGTENAPYKTIKQGVIATGDGGTVYLKASPNYYLTSIGGSNYVHWTTVTAAPGLDADDVQIKTYGKDSTSTGRYSKNSIRWHRVNLYCDRNPGWGSILYLNTGHRIWLDEAVLYDKNGRFANSTLFNGSGATTYLTNTHIHDVANCGGGFQRGSLIEDICSDIFRGSTNLTAINVTIRRIDKGTTSAHPDFIQFYNPSSTVQNVILYNVRAYDMLAQGIFGADGAVKDIAFVNLLLEKDPPNSALRSQLTGTWDHALLWNATIVDQIFDFRTSTNITNFDLRNGVFAQLTTDNVAHPSISIDSAHTKTLSSGQSTPLGTNPTSGNPIYMDEATDDYRLSTSSPGYGTGTLQPGVPADIDGYPFNPATPNRGVFAASNPGLTPPPIASLSASAVDFADASDPDEMEVSTTVLADPTRRYLVRATQDLTNWKNLPPLYADPEGRLFIREKLPAPVDARFYQLEPWTYPQ